MLFKKFGAKWSNISKKFKNRTENQVKNRFYSTLRRIATKKRRESPELNIPEPKSKNDLLKYVDDALEYGHNCCSKRGRVKRRTDSANSPDALPSTKAIVRPSPIVPYPSVSAFVPFENLPIRLVPSIPATPEQMELARQLFKPLTNPNQTPELLLQMERREKEIAELQQSIINSLFYANLSQGKLPMAKIL